MLEGGKTSIYSNIGLFYLAIKIQASIEKKLNLINLAIKIENLRNMKYYRSNT